MPTAAAVSFDDYLTLPSEAEPWLLKPLIPVSGMANLYGAPKTRKSFLALQIARAIAGGDDLFEMPTKKSKVLYIQLDTPRAIWQDRLQKLIAAGEDFRPEVRANIILADSQHAPFPFNIMAPDAFLWLKAQVTSYKPDLVIIDVLRKIFKGSEDKSEVMEEVMGTLKLACMPSAVLFVSHARKLNPEYDSGVTQENRGSGSIPGSCDTIMRLKKATKKKPGLLEWEGRACEDTALPLIDLPSLFFAPVAASPFQAAIDEVVADSTLKTTYAKAKALSERTKESFEKCKGLLYRLEV